MRKNGFLAEEHSLSNVASVQYKSLELSVEIDKKDLHHPSYIYIYCCIIKLNSEQL